ncbi:MAG: TonB-dependent receptor [Gammaproteobacteria bacterium]|nr:TonB-dependent receptor [Gammaproteobacteria bacterium]
MNSPSLRAIRRNVFLILSVASLVISTGHAEDEIIVTGSRIRLDDFTATSPIATVSSDVIESTGKTNIEQLLNTLPQVVPGFSATSNNPGDGTATVDLRGLGATRTLVLINGRRLNPSVNDGTVDLNNVPTRLIERIEVVTGGASAVYGSDALAGVVNFILKEDFEGLDIGYQNGFSDEGDGNEYQLDMVLGGNFAEGRGNTTVYASYYDRESISQADRSYTRVDVHGGSSTGITGRLDEVSNNPFTPSGNYAFDADGSVRPFDDRLPETNGGVGDRYNFAPDNFLLTPQKRFQLGGLGRFEINDHAEAYAELLYVDSRSETQLAPTPATSIRVDLDSPFLSQSALDLLATRDDPDGPVIFRRRMVELGARSQESDSKLGQVTAGLRGDIDYKDWQYDTYMSYGRTDFDYYTRNDVSRSRFEAGIAGCPADYLQFNPGCVAVNPFGAGNISADAADWVRLNFADSTVFRRTVVNGTINGTLMELPAGDMGFALGAEYREDKSSYRPDQAKQSGDVLGFNAQQPISGSFDVKELFGELRIPLLKDTPGIGFLDAELGIRYSDYSTVGDVTAYKAGLNWSPIDAVRVRGMYQRASRAPSLFEVLENGDQGYTGIYYDPCEGLDPLADPDTAAFCATQGITDTLAFSTGSTQIEFFEYGSTALEEETTDTWTLGFVLQPESVPDLQISVDYWNIKVDDYITALAGGPFGIIDACFASLDLNSPACYSDALGAPLIYRDLSGELKVNVPLVNESELETSGIDLQFQYGIPMDFASSRVSGLGETLQLSFVLSWLDEYVLDGIHYEDTSGYYNIQGTFPEWKAVLRLAYDIGPVNVAWVTSYIDDMDNQGNIPEFADDTGYSKIPSHTYHDLSAAWAIDETFELSAGIRNLFDKEPPVYDNYIDQNTDPSTYDMVGRFYFAGVRAKF